ncbi:hypothetical protein CYR40_10240 [Chimaeribacter arupi]|nr:hypothetical protein CYR40_10240 [Chimaeribacter arupi]
MKSHFRAQWIKNHWPLTKNHPATLALFKKNRWDSQAETGGVRALDVKKCLQRGSVPINIYSY